MKDIYDIIAESGRRRGEMLALATLVRASGSSYRRPGARMLVAVDGIIIGVLSGGCLEEEVAARAQEVIATGVPHLLRFDTRLRYGCNGAIDVFVEKLRSGLFDQIEKAILARRDCLVGTTFANSHSLGSRLLAEQPTGSSGDMFVQLIHPPLRLLLVGRGPDDGALQSLARTLGWQVIEVDNASELPNELDEWTAAVVKTHHYGRDFAALAQLLPMGLSYVALLGPRRRRDQLLHALHEDQIAVRSTFFGPAGLDLGAESPEEIALAIVSEIQATFAKASGRSLCERRLAIHSSARYVAA
jgi:xanthine/CO dehydrogenase XdhC/CoxF family maturation factor